MWRQWRPHSSEYVLHNMIYFHFEDDNISLNKKRFSDILDSIIINKLDKEIIRKINKVEFLLQIWELNQEYKKH